MTTPLGHFVTLIGDSDIFPRSFDGNPSNKQLFVLEEQFPIEPFVLGGTVVKTNSRPAYTLADYRPVFLHQIFKETVNEFQI